MVVCLSENTRQNKVGFFRQAYNRWDKETAFAKDICYTCAQRGSETALPNTEETS